MCADDARRLSLAEGAGIRLISESSEFRGFVRLAPIKPGNLEVHWPEGFPLLSPENVDPESREPDYNAVVRDLNTAIQQFPSNLIAGRYNFARRDFFELEAPAEERKPVKVGF